MNLRDQLLKAGRALGERWRSLPAGRKAVAVLAGAGILASLIYLGGLIFTPRYAVLFSNLQAAEAGTIAGKLQQMKVPYRLADQGQTIEVPENEVYNVRIELASDGTLQNTDSGWSLFDQNKFGMTDFEQQVDYQRALQTELRNTIVQMNGVQDAVVNLVIPQKSVFLQNTGTASASVLLKLQPGTSLTPDQVQGVVDLVLGSVEGLKPENVHIVDTNGRILNGNAASQDQNLAAATLNQQKVTEAYDQALQQKLQTMLDQVLGPGQSVSTVTAELNFDQKQTEQVQYQAGQVLSEQKSSSSGTGTGIAGAVPGTQSNTSTTAPSYQSGSQGTGSYQTNNDTTNYDVPSTKVTDVQAPGTVTRISTAVVVNSTQPVDQGKIQAVVAAAIGFDPSRGDQLTVESMPFNTTYATNLAQQMAQAQARERQTRLIELGAGALLGLIVMVVVLIMLMRRRRPSVEFLEEGLPAGMVPEGAQPVGELSEEDKKAFFSVDEKLELIRELAKDKPEDVAEIVKVWIKE